MKNSPHPREENEIGIRMSMNRGTFENVRLRGTNAGACMVAGGGGESSGSCSINIYVNNDIQGVNNSVLVGSEVRLGDPGVSLSFEGVNMDRGFRLVTTKKGPDSTHFILLLAFAAFVISLAAYFSV